MHFARVPCEVRVRLQAIPELLFCESPGTAEGALTAAPRGREGDSSIVLRRLFWQTASTSPRKSNE